MASSRTGLSGAAGFGAAALTAALPVAERVTEAPCCAKAAGIRVPAATETATRVRDLSRKALKSVETQGEIKPGTEGYIGSSDFLRVWVIRGKNS